MALGHPNTSKSTAIECALSVIGRANIPLGGNEIHIDVITFKNPIFIYEQDIVSVHRYAVEGTKWRFLAGVANSPSQCWSQNRNDNDPNRQYTLLIPYPVAFAPL